MIKARKQSNQEEQEEEKESEENLSIYKDLYYLKDPVYYRQQVLQILIKMSEAKPDGMGWKNCVKLSDSKGKHTGNKRTVELYKEELGI